MQIARKLGCLAAALLIPAAWGVSQTDPPQRPAHRWAHGGTGFTGEQQMRGMGRGRGPGPGAFPPFFDQLAKMPKEDRQKALEADPHFTRLPPNRQADVRERLERFSAMTPEQQQEMRDRFTIMSRLSPQHRDQVREVFSRWQKLPEDRRQAVRDEFRSLSAKPGADREKRLSDPEFQKAFSAPEQQILKDLAGLLRGPDERPNGGRKGGRSN